MKRIIRVAAALLAFSAGWLLAVEELPSGREGFRVARVHARPNEPEPGPDTNYSGEIVVAQQTLLASKKFAPALEDLRTHLQKITGSSFKIQRSGSRSGIFLWLSSSPMAPVDAVERLRGKSIEAFAIVGDERRLEIVANDELGLAQGVYFYLEALGVRWLLPNEHWTVTPAQRDITLRIDRVLEPAFKVRDYGGTGGYFSWRWGRSYTGSAALQAQTEQWRRRMRYGGEYRLGKSVGEAFVSDKTITPILASHPEYLAQVGGKYSPLYLVDKTGHSEINDIAKLNAGNPDAVELFCNWALRELDDPSMKAELRRSPVLSVEPSDGGGYGDNYAELPGNGSGSDQTFYIANHCARMARTRSPDAAVILLAYAGHAQPPSFPLEKNVLVQLAPYAFQGAEPERFIAGWGRKASRLALYDYWSIPDWSHDEPSFDYLDLAQRLRYWRAHRIEAINAETTYSAGAMGLGHYVAAHLMWDLNQDERELIEDWYDKAFGPAKVPMKRMLERWAQSFRLTSAEIGTSYRDLSEAASHDGGDPQITARIDDFAVYLQYLRLRLEAANASDQAAKSRATMSLVQHLLSINDTAMVHTTRIIDTDTKPHPDIVAAFSLADPKAPGPGWGSIRPLSHRQIQALVLDGAKNYPPATWAPKSYRGALKSPKVADAPSPEENHWETPMPTIGDLNLFIDVREGLTKIPLRVTRAVDNELRISDAKGRVVFEKRIEAAQSNGLSTWEELAVPVASGLYQVHFHPAGGRASGYFSFQTWKGVPLIMRDFLSIKQTPAPRLYFYVPRGLGKLALYLPHSDWNGAFHFQVHDADGAPVQIDYRDGRRMLEIKVPPGQDEKIWSCERMVSPELPPQLLNAPQAFSFSPETLMIPSDAF